MTRITVMRDRYVRGWPTNECGDRAFVLPLGEALERRYRTDAHFAAYTTPNGRRLTRGAIDAGISVELSAVFFDFDCQDVHGSSIHAPEQWRRGIRERVLDLFGEHGRGYYYETRGGARVVFCQEEPTIIVSHADAIEWSQAYAVLVAYLARRFDLQADAACNDWQRLFRAPRATRTCGGNPENWPIFGDPNNIADLFVEASPEDVATAARASKAFGNRTRDLDAPGAVDTGLLYWVLRQRGDLGGDAPRGGWIARCPNRTQHTSKTDGTDATVVYPARAGGELGSIHCLHAHCARFTVKDWLAFFSDAEKSDARERAGIARRAA